MHFVDVLIRQAHPDPGVRPYRTFDEKLRDAQRYKQDEGIPWPVLVDDLEGTVHQVYGGLTDPTYLIDADGRVAYYTMWTHAPNISMRRSKRCKRGGIAVSSTMASITSFTCFRHLPTAGEGSDEGYRRAT